MIRRCCALALAFLPLIVPGALHAAESLRYAGATTLQQHFMPEAARQFEQQTGTSFVLSGGNTDPGLQALLGGSAHLAGAGRFLTAEEKRAGLVETLIGWDPLVVVVHASNPIQNLTLAQLRAICSGTIVNWREVGGRDLPILPVLPPPGSAMRSTIEQLTMAGQPLSRRAIVSMVVADADQQVEQLPAGITILSRSLVDAATIHVASVDGQLPSSAAIADKRYPLIKPLVLVTKGKAKGMVARFIEFATGKAGQAILGRKFIPLAAR